MNLLLRLQSGGEKLLDIMGSVIESMAMSLQ